jgi:flavin reductase (DIM6/NTAB) family NADH-FMN oxidoreductase RutF
MGLTPISFENLQVRSHHLWNQQYLLLTCGDYKTNDFNAMTVGWGSLGTMWGKPFTQVVVRPHRYTFEFMEKYSTFTLCAFPEKYSSALTLLGTRSGRQGNKIAASELTPIASSLVAAPSFAEAELRLECKKIYWQDLDPQHFLDESIHSKYPSKDYHRIYFGEIVAIFGSDPFNSQL